MPKCSKALLSWAVVGYTGREWVRQRFSVMLTSCHLPCKWTLTKKFLLSVFSPRLVRVFKSGVENTNANRLFITYHQAVYQITSHCLSHSIFLTPCNTKISEYIKIREVTWYIQRRTESMAEDATGFTNSHLVGYLFSYIMLPVCVFWSIHY